MSEYPRIWLLLGDHPLGQGGVAHQVRHISRCGVMGPRDIFSNKLRDRVRGVECHPVALLALPKWGQGQELGEVTSAGADKEDLTGKVGKLVHAVSPVRRCFPVCAAHCSVPPDVACGHGQRPDKWVTPIG